MQVPWASCEERNLIHASGSTTASAPCLVFVLEKSSEGVVIGVRLYASHVLVVMHCVLQNKRYPTLELMHTQVSVTTQVLECFVHECLSMHPVHVHKVLSMRMPWRQEKMRPRSTTEVSSQNVSVSMTDSVIIRDTIVIEPVAVQGCTSGGITSRVIPGGVTRLTNKRLRFHR
jgi:hypothetical protein